MKPADLRAVVEAQEDRATWRQGDFERDKIFVREPNALGGPVLGERVVMRANASLPHVRNLAAVVALHNHAEALIDLAEAVRVWRDAECETESSETDDYTIAALTDECAGDTHTEACQVSAAHRAMRGALAKLEAIS